MKCLLLSVSSTLLLAILFGHTSLDTIPEDIRESVVSANEVPCNNEYSPAQNAVWTDNCEKAVVDCNFGFETKKIKGVKVSASPPYVEFNEITIPIVTGGVCPGDFVQGCELYRSGSAGGGVGSVTDAATFNCPQYGKYDCKYTSDFLTWTALGIEWRSLFKVPKCTMDGTAPIPGSNRFCGTYGVVATCGNEIDPPSTDPPVYP